MNDSTIKLGDYLLNRLSQLGTKSVQGVPGDFNLGFLDLVEDHKEVEWVGNANELNAAYSADGYARTLNRLKPSVSALVTTFGVGELSAANGVSGALSERVPVVHIVGSPATSAQEKGALLHHTLGDGRYHVFESVGKSLSTASAILGEHAFEDCGKEIDRVLTRAVVEARPVYISLPTNYVHAKISSKALSTPLSTSAPPNDSEAESFVLNEMLNKIKAAKDPLILVDACTIRHGVVKETRQLVESSGLPVYSTPMGKSAIDEGYKQFGGVYVGSVSEPELKKRVEEADLLISIGALKSDFNTGNFSYRTPRSSTIELHSTHVSIGYAEFSKVGMKELLPKLSQALSSQRESRLKHTLSTLTKFENVLPTREQEDGFEGKDGQAISQAYFWPKMGSFFKKGDSIVVETGTSCFGSLETKLPEDTNFVAQVLWGSIGWSVGATLGTALAARELGMGRVALFVGDGSLQLSVQEITTMIRQGLTPYLFVLSNDGYEIERQIHGPERSYNNTMIWNHRALLEALQPPKDEKLKQDSSDVSHQNDKTLSETKYFSCRTKKELEALLEDDQFNKANELKLIEVFLPRGDAPRALKSQAKATSGNNDY